jgi:hypothetical protein
VRSAGAHTGGCDERALELPAGLPARIAAARLDLLHLHEMSLRVSAHTEEPLIAVMELEIRVVTG